MVAAYLHRRGFGVAGLAVLLGAAAPPPPSVEVTTIAAQDVAPVSTFIGHVEAIQSVKVVPRVTAFIEDEPAPQGSVVKAGQVLFQLQTTQYQAALESAQAQLQSAQAALRNAQITYERDARLVHQDVTAQSDLDSATATRDEDQANVLAGEAAVAQAALNLSYCTITAPIDGRIGVITLTKGNLVTPSTPTLATVNQMDPIRVVFSVSDRDVISVQRKTGSSPDKIAAGLSLQLVLPDGSTYDHKGRISFIDNQVDASTGTIAVYADFANPDRLLVPGAYVNVQVRQAKPEVRPLVPVAAVQTDNSGSYVLVVGADNKIAQQSVQLGQQIAQNYVVSKGLTAGQKVVVEGVQKVHPGETVSPQAAPPPSGTSTDDSGDGTGTG
jgi:membrane fusion protein (multidrug efflux system)